MILINEIYINLYLKNNNLITYKGILFLIKLIKNKQKLNKLLLKLGFSKNNYINNKNINDFFYKLLKYKIIIDLLFLIENRFRYFII